jgi:hypothetical protein
MRFQIVFAEADLSTTQRSAWIEIPPTAKKGAVCIGCTATGAPSGEVAIEISGHGMPGVSGQAYSPAPASGPAGGAFRDVYDGIDTAARYLCVVYNASSGGTGAHWTDDSGVDGTKPYIEFKE